MAIENYLRPQLTIEQLLAETATVSADRIVPLVIGPQYLLSRYGKETNVYGETFDASGMAIPYKYYDSSSTLQALPTGYTVDLDTLKLYGVGLEAQLAQFLKSGAAFKIESTANSHILKIQSDYVIAPASGGSLHASFLGRDVEIGDIVYVYVDDSTSSYKRRTVVGFKGADVAATTSDPENSEYNPVTDASEDTGVQVSAPTGWTVTRASTPGTTDLNVRGGSVIGTKLAEEFTITVRTPGAAATATVDIASKSGDYAATDVATASDGGTGYDITDSNAGGELAGVNLNLDAGGSTLQTGQVFVFRVYQAYERLATDISSDNQIDSGGTYTGTKDTTYLLTVKTGTAVGSDSATGAVITITDTAGVDEPEDVTITDNTAFDVGSYGVTATIKLSGLSAVTHGGLRAGDVYAIPVTAATQSTTKFDRVVLDGPAVDTTTFTDPSVAVKVQFRTAFTGEIAATDAADLTAWTADADSVDLDASHSLYVDERSSGNKWVAYVDGVGKVYPSYRASLPAPSTEDKISITSVSDITTKLGDIDLDNDLAFGANEALSGVQGAKKVWALRTAGTTLADYTAALRKIESTDMLYAIAVLSDDLTIQQAVASHCESMSSKTKKNFRRCYVGTDSPGSYAVLTQKQDSTNYTATISDYAGANLLLATADDVDFRTLGLEAGDLVKLTATDDEYEIAEILSATEIVLKTGPAAPVSPAVPFQLWRADTPSSQADFVIARSSALNSRRCANVWVEDGKRLIDGVMTIIPNRFVAAEIAGLRCAVLPQQGLTRTEIQSVTDAASMYVRYTQDELDAVAAAGTFIVTQEAESGSVFIRHQLTTESDKGSLYYEDSVGVNLDNISFLVKDSLDGFIGQKNVTAKTLSEVQKAVSDILTDKTLVPANASYGPALNGYEGLSVTVHETLKDRILVYAKLLMPLPLNNIEVTLEGDVDLTL